MNDIPVNTPRLDGNERRYLNECIVTGWVSSEGPFIRKLEEGLAERVGQKHGIAVSNGSAALEAAVAALDLGRGDEVILPSFTIISCAAAIVRAGATPLVVDSDPLTWNIDVTQLAAQINARTKAIMIVHLYGDASGHGASACARATTWARHYRGRRADARSDLSWPALR